MILSPDSGAARHWSPARDTQVRTRDRKGLMYDSMRAAKDLKVNLSYGKVRVSFRWSHLR